MEGRKHRLSYGFSLFALSKGPPPKALFHGPQCTVAPSGRVSVFPTFVVPERWNQEAPPGDWGESCLHSDGSREFLLPAPGAYAETNNR